jgi:hypothetical protein
MAEMSSGGGGDVRPLFAKLCHQLDEVRCRALRNIRTKLRLELLSSEQLDEQAAHVVQVLIEWMQMRPL